MLYGLTRFIGLRNAWADLIGNRHKKHTAQSGAVISKDRGQRVGTTMRCLLVLLLVLACGTNTDARAQQILPDAQQTSERID